ncbi:putative transporter [Trypanosoma theileri]|uniref:Putative transporter n=1 Tax=Trypanosoma theileri TaxID=67003 RepID=A0A1X0NZ29_9TRYP|nr:putative transporter [Trypanosoma theileri]ORC89935.1 putative transporter [Trypanosoma theileri]
MFGVTVVAVTKVIVAVCIGAFTCRKIPNASVTIRDFSFIIANILLPSLTFYNTAVSVNAELLLRSSVLIVFAVFVIGLGLVCAALASKVLYPVKNTGIPYELRKCLRYTLIYQNAEGSRASRKERRRNRKLQKQQQKQQERGERGQSQSQQQPQQQQEKLLRPVVCIVVSGELEKQRVEPEEILPLIEPPAVEYEEQPFYYYATMTACSIQNTVTLPLSLLQALAASLAWIDLAAGTSYIFIYSVFASAYLWSAGPVLVGRAKKETEKRRTIRKILEQHKKLQNCRDVATQTVLRRESSRMASPNFPISLPMPIPIGPVSTTTPPPAPLPPPSSSSSSVSSFSSAAVVAESVRVSVMDTIPTREPTGMMMKMMMGAHSTGEQVDLQASNDQAPPLLSAAQGFCQTFPYDWRKRGLIRVVYSQEFKDEDEAKPSMTSILASVARTIKNTVLRLLGTLAFTSVVAGVVVGIVPPLRWLVFEGPLSMVMDSIALVAAGSIPSSLLLLGGNLAGGAHQATTETEVRLREAEQNTEFPLDDDTEEPKYVEKYNAAHASIEFDEHASFTLIGLQQEEQRLRELQIQQQQQQQNGHDNQRGATSTSSSSEGYGMIKGALDLFSLNGVRKSFVFGVLFLRLLLMPTIGFTLVLALRAAVPSLFGGKTGHDVLLLVLLGELAAPTAINAALLFNSAQYMPGVWAKMMFFQYICCTLSFVLWCTLSLYFAG